MGVSCQVQGTEKAIAIPAKQPVKGPKTEYGQAAAQNKKAPERFTPGALRGMEVIVSVMGWKNYASPSAGVNAFNLLHTG